MQIEMSYWHLVSNASPVVQFVMVILLLASIMSWTFIFRKWRTVAKARRAADDFEKRFWSGGDLGAIYKQVLHKGKRTCGMENIFVAGFKEFARLRKQGNARAMDVVQGAQRAMRVTQAREMDDLETHLSFLATVGSTSPYVGLFGTVWGIMNSFRALGNVEQATLSLVAPGIAEALIATAIGLFAAIPAVVAYNRFADHVERLDNRYDNFSEEFSTILQRYAHEAKG